MSIGKEALMIVCIINYTPIPVAHAVKELAVLVQNDLITLLEGSGNCDVDTSSKLRGEPSLRGYGLTLTKQKVTNLLRTHSFTQRAVNC